MIIKDSLVTFLNTSQKKAFRVGGKVKVYKRSFFNI